MNRFLGTFFGVGVLLAFLATGCAASKQGAKPTSTLEATTVELTAREILQRAVQRLEAATSYKVKITLRHHWQFEKKEQAWDFSGEAQYAGPNRFRSWLEGPADSIFSVSIDGDKVTGQDMRGEVPNATKAFGGPGVGTAPYTAIHYLKHFEQVDKAETASLDGTKTYRITFVPNLRAVAALDAGHAQAIPQVRAAKGTVWVDVQSYLVRQLVLEIEFIARSGDVQKAISTLQFSDFDQPVEFK